MKAMHLFGVAVFAALSVSAVSAQMATPVPVVSMMYFLVSMPPKISCIVRPDFSATSVKLAISLAGGAFVCWEKPEMTDADRIKAQASR